MERDASFRYVASFTPYAKNENPETGFASSAGKLIVFWRNKGQYCTLFRQVAGNAKGILA